MGVCMGWIARIATRTRMAVAFILVLATLGVVAFRHYINALEGGAQTSRSQAHSPANAAQPSQLFNGKPGLSLNDPKAFQGYTLFAPLSSTKTYLIDMKGRVVRTW